jgi:lysozyme
MRLNSAGIKLLHDFEGLRLTSYLCPAGVWTIGYGNTFYEDGTPVRSGQTITKERAEQLFLLVANRFASDVQNLLRRTLNENQFSALVSFAYNVGIGNLRKSTLLRKVNANPRDTTIRTEFLKWNKASGRELAGLTRRRQAEAVLFFS